MTHYFPYCYRLAKLFTEAKRIEDVMDLLKGNGDFFSAIPKAKTAKIVRSILNIVATIPDSLEVQVRLCKDVVEWCVAEKRTFLRQRIESKVYSCGNVLCIISTLSIEWK